MKRTVIGTVAALVSMALLTGVMLPLRDHLSIATTALVLVVPVVIGVVIGGFAVGVLGVIAGFLVYDFFFIPPYLTLWVGRSENWAALAVYVAVMLPVARTVAGLNAARARERRQGAELRELFELSGLLLEDKKLDELLTTVVTMVAEVFGSRQVAVFLPNDGRLEVAAAFGDPLTEDQIRRVLPSPGELARLSAQPDLRGEILVHALTAAGRPVARPGRRPRARAAQPVRQPDRAGGRARPAARAGPADQADRGSGTTRQDPRRRRVPRPPGAAGEDQGVLVDPGRQRDRARSANPPEPGGAHRQAGRPAGRPGAEPARHEPDPGRRAAAPPRRKLAARARRPGARRPGPGPAPAPGAARPAGRAAGGGRGRDAHLPGTDAPARERD